MCNTENSVLNTIETEHISFHAVYTAALKWPFAVETGCNIKDITYIGCVESILFLLL